MRVIDRSLFMTDDGRTIFVFGPRVFFVPDADVAVVLQRQSMLGFAIPVFFLGMPLVGMMFGELPTYAWFVFAIGAILVSVRAMLGWLRSRFTDVHDPTLQEEIRELRRGTSAPRWMRAAAPGAYLVLYYASKSGPHGGFVSIAVLLLVSVLMGIELAAAKSRRVDLDSRISTSITR